eukprot:CAMPEP_0179957460 /NCGR_PEP_ID=MMETSP0983-20121128/27454_1 /TAXON_ID=483367 /ORGANISM="non described non described, Strain CCMP 2436" /LENGTH=58 /DNA_ID=CAMNT_0021869415 /DNA_START=112 /DNA_END=291 /DNA_ORIENTATION=+
MRALELGRRCEAEARVAAELRGHPLQSAGVHPHQLERPLCVVAVVEEQRAHHRLAAGR